VVTLLLFVLVLVILIFVVLVVGVVVRLEVVDVLTDVSVVVRNNTTLIL
jgi:hypothetical protein